MPRNNVRNGSTEEDLVKLGRRYQARLAAGTSNRELARELGIVEGSIRNALLFAKAAELAGTRPGWPSEAEIAAMSIRQVRALLVSDGTEDAPGLKRLKAAWQGADEADRAAFTRWAGLNILTPEKGPDPVPETVAAPIATRAVPLRISGPAIGEDATPAKPTSRPQQLDIKDFIGTRPPTPSAPAKGEPRPEWLAYGAAVRAARLAKGMNQPAVAEALGMSRSAVGNIETGRFNAGADVRVKLRDLLGVEG